MANKLTHNDYINQLKDKEIKHIPLEEYQGAHQKIKHKCPEGHVWDITPMDIKQGYGCPHCSGTIKLTQNKYIEKIKKMGCLMKPIEDYKNRHEPINHMCVCGNIYKISPHSVISRKRKTCKYCVKENENKRKVWNKKELLENIKGYNKLQDWKKNNPGAYDFAWRNNLLHEIKKKLTHKRDNYSLNPWSYCEILKKAKTYKYITEFISSEAGAWTWLLNRNLTTQFKNQSKLIIGNSGFKIDDPAILYYLKINNGQAYKIGITNKSVNERFSKTDLKKIQVIQIWKYYSGKEALDQETKIKREFNYAIWKNEPLLKDGNSELFDRDVLLLDI